jgi:hypothetical protein
MADDKQLNQEAQEQKEQKDKDFDKQNKKPTDDELHETDRKENESEPKKGEEQKPGESCCR